MSDVSLDVAAPPKRVFTVDEANRLLPVVEGILRRMDAENARARELGDLVEDLEAYWGKAVESAANEDHAEYLSLRAELAERLRAIGEAVVRLGDLGCALKDSNRGVVDFHAYVDGDLVCLCWQRGEASVRHWHTLDGGFEARRPLP